LVVPGENDAPDELKRLAEFIAAVSPNIPWHVSRFHPEYKQRDKQPTPAETIFKALETGEKAGLKYVYAGNMAAGRYENTYCPNCGELVVERSGFSSRATGLSGSKCSRCGEQLNIVVDP
jgi:pyruvate formate lyase activating enzyme